jgi:catechol 2,3-dioxygenase-like lactoylglutathione lyase family enzyme
VIRVELPSNLRTLANVGRVVELKVDAPVTQRSVLDALEAAYPMLRGTIRDQITRRRRPMLRFFACEEDLSDESMDAPLPDDVATGREPYLIVGAIAGGAPKSIDAITLFVEDLEGSKLFYQKVFGLSVSFEDDSSAVFKFENNLINLLKIPAARDLIEPGIVASHAAGSRFQLTIPVDDVDAACAELRARGVTLLNGPMDRVWGVRTASFTDPSGHIWEFAQRLPRAADS